MAFLPINGARIQRDPMPETPAVLTPTQALDAALLLQAKTIVPIHFGLNDPPYYVEIDEPLESLSRQAEQRDQAVQHLILSYGVMAQRLRIYLNLPLEHIALQ